ncbi:MAG TPA: phosphoribosylanthranilate isomerase [Rudaea sp.]|nr:phosphoribosylanthranilate isomerase [Rudaea sp.]
MTSQRVRVKFCGFTRRDDALAACTLGVDAIGMVLTTRSKRFAGIANARDIRRALPPFVAVVTLFMDDEPALIAEAVATVRPDLLQFHGSEEAPDCVRYGLPYLKAVAMGGAGRIDWRAVVAAHPQAAGFLFDGNAPGEQGGSGKRLDWAQLPAKLSAPVVLAGGLTPENVGDAIRLAHPYAVDVSSAIESAPGVKDVEKMRRFVAAVRSSE